MWLKDLLPVDIPDSRILTYGYDSRVKNSIDDSSISGYAMQLLEELSYFRRNESVSMITMPDMIEAYFSDQAATLDIYCA